MDSSILKINDYVGLSFWIISMAMAAATFFFFMERSRAEGKWKTSISVAALVTGIATIHYFYMREFWIATGTSPTSYRYIDWVLTVPLQIVEFYLILTAITKVRVSLFWKLLVGSLVMIVFGYLGETDVFNVWLGFGIGMVGWLYILYLIFLGEAGKINSQSGTPACKQAFNALRIIVSIGWAIYPIGYIFGYLISDGQDVLNIVYNLADFINKIAFGVVVWIAATRSNTEAKQ